MAACIAGFALLAMGHQPAALAEGFTVSPMSVTLGSGARSATLTLRNDDAAPKSFSIRALAWHHDEQGNEQFEESTDLIYFPRLLTLEPDQQALVRLGLRLPPAQVERSWRLLVEELPAPGTKPSGSRVRVRVRFGVPVFATPAPSVVGRAIALVADDVTRREGSLRWSLRNAGGQHELFEQLSVRGLDAQGQPLFAHEAKVRYLLAGERRRLTVEVPATACARLAGFAVQGKTKRGLFEQTLEVPPAACP
jgi:fimbrial chaperone protein